MPDTPLDDADPICRMSAEGMQAAFAAGTLSPREAARACLDRARIVDERCNAFVSIDEEAALAMAASSEARWRAGAPLSPIDGVPTTIKDIVWIEGIAAAYGSRVAEARPAPEDSPAVARLRAAGAVLIGRTTTPEFGWKAVTDGPLSGVTRNPWDLALTPGGSSGGAAVAAAAGAGVLHLGTDGGGSIRIPAAFTGTVGLKPRFGRVAAHPASAFGTLAHIGPMARSVDDAARMLAAMAGRDERDFAQGPWPLPPLEAPETDLSGRRLGVWRKPAGGTLDSRVEAVFDAALARLASDGAILEAIELPAGFDLPAIFETLWFAGAAARLAALRLGEDAAGLDRGFLEIAAKGRAASAADHAAASSRRGEFGRAMDALLTRFDALVSPGVAVPPFEAGREVPEGSGLARWTRWAGFSFPVNLSQQPALVLPCGLDAAGLPVGLQLVGTRGGDGPLLALALAIERRFAEAG